jgi:hypothetical protein
MHHQVTQLVILNTLAIVRLHSAGTAHMQLRQDVPPQCESFIPTRGRCIRDDSLISAYGQGARNLVANAMGVIRYTVSALAITVIRCHMYCGALPDAQTCADKQSLLNRGLG